MKKIKAEILDEIKKDKNDFLKNKLDLIKQFFTTLLVIDAGLFGFLFLNFERNERVVRMIYVAILAVVTLGVMVGWAGFKIAKI